MAFTNRRVRVNVALILAIYQVYIIREVYQYGSWF